MSVDTSEPETDVAKRSWWPVPVIVLAVLAAIAVVAWSVWPRQPEDPVTARDEALRAGEAGVASLTTIDFRSPDEGLDRWAAAATGPLRDTLAKGRDASRAQVVAGRSAMTGRVADAALTELDTAAGTAKLIAAAEITVSPETGQPQVKQDRFEAGLTRTDAGWKLSALRSVPVPAQAENPATPPFDAAATTAVTAQIRGAVERIFSYAPDRIDATDQTATQVLSGAAIADYRKLIDQVRANARDVTVRTTVPIAGVRALGDDHARLLVFLDQTETRAGQATTSTASTLTVLVEHQGGAWKITDLIPH